MWYKTKASEILHINYPILLGPLNAGGLGGYGAYTLSPGEIIQVDQQLMRSIIEETNICTGGNF